MSAAADVTSLLASRRRRWRPYSGDVGRRGAAVTAAISSSDVIVRNCYRYSCVVAGYTDMSELVGKRCVYGAKELAMS
jgi:hypothetical protein